MAALNSQEKPPKVTLQEKQQSIDFSTQETQLSDSIGSGLKFKQPKAEAKKSRNNNSLANSDDAFFNSNKEVNDGEAVIFANQDLAKQPTESAAGGTGETEILEKNTNKLFDKGGCYSKIINEIERDAAFNRYSTYNPALTPI